MIREQAGRVIRFKEENMPVPGCTISKQMVNEQEIGVSVFSLASGTSISAEVYTYSKLWTVYDGKMEVFTGEGSLAVLSAGESILTPVGVPVGVRSTEHAVYLETELRKESSMNQLVKAGEVFSLKELLPYQEGKIVNMDLVNENNVKFVLMSFDEGCALSEHAAPGEALVFALDGEAVIGYEGEDHVLHAGETFKFDKLGKHSVRALTKFKMGLLLMME